MDGDKLSRKCQNCNKFASFFWFGYEIWVKDFYAVSGKFL